MSIETIVAMAVPVIALIFTVMTFSKNAKKDTTSDATERATMSSDIKYIRGAIDDIKVDNRVIKSDISDLQTTVWKANTKNALNRSKTGKRNTDNSKSAPERCALDIMSYFLFGDLNL